MQRKLRNKRKEKHFFNKKLVVNIEIFVSNKNNTVPIYASQDM